MSRLLLRRLNPFLSHSTPFSLLKSTPFPSLSDPFSLPKLMPFLSHSTPLPPSLLFHQKNYSQQESSKPEDAIHLTENCIRRMRELHAKEISGGEQMLRLSVETGGCSGFQYVFLLDDMQNPDDRVFEKDGVKLVVDNISYDFVKGSTVDYVEELIRSAFQVTTNPSAVGGCSCKSSFMVK